MRLKSLTDLKAVRQLYAEENAPKPEKKVAVIKPLTNEELKLNILKRNSGVKLKLWEYTEEEVKKGLCRAGTYAYAFNQKEQVWQIALIIKNWRDYEMYEYEFPGQYGTHEAKYEKLKHNAEPLPKEPVEEYSPEKDTRVKDWVKYKHRRQ